MLVQVHLHFRATEFDPFLLVVRVNAAPLHRVYFA